MTPEITRVHSRMLWSSATVCMLVMASGLAAAAGMPVRMSATANAPDGKPTIIGVTNLPEGTELLVTISRAASGYQAQDKTSALNGNFRSSQFSDKSQPLLPGKYQANIVAPLAAVQPSIVRAAVGENYSNFAGPLMKRSRFGTTVEYTTTFVIPGQTNSQLDLAARRSQSQALWDWRRKSCREAPELAEALARQPMAGDRKRSLVEKCLAEVEADLSKSKQP